jgi:hypothetical protein
MADMSKINDWLQVVGMFGVIASLIFVGLQMKQAHQIALSEIYQSRSDATASMSISTATSPELLAAISKIYSGRSTEMTMPEAVAFEHYLGATMTMFENNHRQYQLGFLSEDHWQRSVAELRCTLAPPLQRQMILNWYFRDSFMQVMQSIVNDLNEGDDSCWVVDWPISDPN